MLKIVSWNIAHSAKPWEELVNSDADVALLQEAGPPPADVAPRFDAGDEPWSTEGAGRPWRTAVVALNQRVQLERITPLSLADAAPGQFAVSLLGTVDAARVTDPDTQEKTTLISMYSPWEHPHGSTESSWIYSDASAHRLVSDISVFVGRQRGHRVLAAGDLNILYRYGEDGSAYWGSRFHTIFDRLDKIGLQFVGPQFPNGRQADPWPKELPPDSLNVPTYRTDRLSPATATRQLDFVFASKAIAPRVKACAMNTPEEWGPSDHCRIRIDLG